MIFFEGVEEILRNNSKFYLSKIISFGNIRKMYLLYEILKYIRNFHWEGYAI